MNQFDETLEADPDFRRSDGFPVIGVGASAGGLEAFQTFLTGISTRHDFAIVMVQHLDPNHDSLLHELLSRKSQLPVVVIEDGMALEAGKVFIIPPNAALKVDGYTLRLSRFEQPRGLRRPIDVFFESLAENHGANCAGVVLSGTGSDGSNGMRAIKNAGGLGLVQDPRQAKYDGMPLSAMDGGNADLSLPAEDIGDVLREFFYRRGDIDDALKEDEEFKLRVAKHLLYRTGHDFSHYKLATMLRRIARRMVVLGISRPNEYLQRLISDEREGTLLFRDLLINVTSFFRDPGAFDTLKAEVIRPLLAGKGKDEEVRIWVPGCATGEEAYSIAILCLQEIDRLDVHPRISIFATDIDEEALTIGREGVYQANAIEDLPNDLVERHFTSTTQGYEVEKPLRDMVRFSRHSFIKDPPFLRLDLVSCRNVIIYFDKWLQDRVMPIFHYALKPDGFLFLGSSENLGSMSENFTPIHTTHKVFRRGAKDAPLPSMPIVSGMSPQPSRVRQARGADEAAISPEAYYRSVVAEHYAPPFAVVDTHRVLGYTSGRIGRYLELGSGVPKLDMVELARPILRPALRRLLTLVGERATKPSSIEWTGDLDGETVRMTIHMRPLRENRRMVVFEELTGRVPVDPNAVAVVSAESVDDSYVRMLEEEIEQAQQTVRTTVEELETSNEELKSSNEEIMSMNEEMQSANEELTTVNDELRKKVVELDTALGDLRNFVNSTNIATVFLDDELAIRTFSPEARRYFRIADQDRGRTLDDLASDVDTAVLMRMSRDVVSSGEVVRREIRTSDGGADLDISIRPYIGVDGEQNGVVIVCIPVTEIRQYARELEEVGAQARRHLNEIEELYRVSPQPMALMASDMTYIRANEGLADINGRPLEEHYGKTIQEIVPDLSDQVTEPVRRVFETGEAMLGVPVAGQTAAEPGVEKKWEVDWYPIRDGEKVTAVGVSVRDVTKFHEMEDELRRVMRELQHRVKNMLSNVIALINRAMRENGERAETLDTLVKRINALATTHNLLTIQNWHSIDFADLLKPELIDVYGPDRITLRGPSVRLSAKAAVALGMTIHELATNAAKYGALAGDEGRLQVKWSRTDEGDGELLVIQWREEGGGPAPQPETFGFGTQLIDSTIRASLLGSIEKHFETTGFRARIEVPLEELQRFDDKDTFARPVGSDGPVS